MSKLRDITGGVLWVAQVSIWACISGCGEQGAPQASIPDLQGPSASVRDRAAHKRAVAEQDAAAIFSALLDLRIDQRAGLSDRSIDVLAGDTAEVFASLLGGDADRLGAYFAALEIGPSEFWSSHPYWIDDWKRSQAFVEGWTLGVEDAAIRELGLDDAGVLEEPAARRVSSVHPRPDRGAGDLDVSDPGVGIYEVVVPVLAEIDGKEWTDGAVGLRFMRHGSSPNHWVLYGISYYNIPSGVVPAMPPF